MSLTINFNSVIDMFCKLQRDADLLYEEVTSDRLFNFLVTGYSMIDWVKNDRSVRYNCQNLYDDQWLKICGDIATGYKHLRLTQRTPITSSVNSATGFGHSRFGKGPFGKGEESITIHLNDSNNDGNSFDCFDLVVRVLQKWDDYFLNNGIVQTSQELQDLKNKAREA